MLQDSRPTLPISRAAFAKRPKTWASAKRSLDLRDVALGTYKMSLWRSKVQSCDFLYHGEESGLHVPQVKLDTLKGFTQET